MIAALQLSPALSEEACPFHLITPTRRAGSTEPMYAPPPQTSDTTSRCGADVTCKNRASKKKCFGIKGQLAFSSVTAEYCTRCQGVYGGFGVFNMRKLKELKMATISQADQKRD